MPRKNQLKPSPPRVAMAIAAHPDDIEFLMAGTLLLLREKGFAIHYMNLSSGSCGSLQHKAGSLRRLRAAESRKAAEILGASYHSSICDDLEILYELRTLRLLASVIRKVGPSILLIPSPQDYMEDHSNTARLAVTAAFARGMPNFKTSPYRPPIDGEVTVYHALPHGLRDGLRRSVIPGEYVNTSRVHGRKTAALSVHQTQQSWLDASQKMNSYLQAMDQMSRQIGRMSGKFTHAEGWRRHSHLGFCAAEADPLAEALGKDCVVNAEYEKGLCLEN